jgi:salicylate hydroxylase
MEQPAQSTVWMGRGRHLVHYPIKGGAEINLVGVVERPDWEEESWTMPGEPAAMRADFGGWHRSVDDLLGRVDTAWRWALHERKPPSVWHAGRAALLGDACHAMPPFLAQGACMALEDAVVLARRMAAEPGNPAHALRDYAEARRERTERAQRESWQNAWRFHLKSGVLRLCVYGALGIYDKLAPGRSARMFDWLYEYDPATA